MANFMLYAPLVIGIYGILFSFMIEAKTIIGMLIYKAPHFFGGLTLLFIFLKQSAII